MSTTSVVLAILRYKSQKCSGSLAGGVCLLFLLSVAVDAVVSWLIFRQEILTGLLQNKTGDYYDNRVPPNFDDEFATEVTVQIYVLSFDSVAESAMEYSVTIFLRQNWSDLRLTWDDDVIKDRLEVDPKFMDMVWTPDLYFVNEKEATVHDVTVINKLLHLYKDGTIQSSMRISMTLSCDMFLERYPHDKQTCSIFAGSYSYSRENVVLKWHNRPVIMRPSLTLPRFNVKFEESKDCEFLFGDGSMIIGNYTCIQADFLLVREFGYYIAQVYVPCVLIVVLSWVSFWIDMDATPARVSLGLLTVLAMTTQSTGEKASLPRVSYLKAIDVWTAVCLIFVFAALLEFAYVNVASRVEKRRRETLVLGDNNKPRNGSTGDSRMEVVDEDVTRGTSRRFVFLRDKAKVQKARFVDKCSRIAFPTVFVLFNVGYWIYYRPG